MIKKAIFFSSITFLLVACTNTKGPVADAVSDCDTANWYTGKIEPIINTNCAISGCHDAASGNGDLSNYNAVKLYADNGKLNNRVLVLKDMPTSPVGPLSEAQRNRINCWLQHGAPQNSTGSSSSTGCSTTISYSSTIAPLVATNCAISGCHNASSVNGDYSTISGLQVDALNGKLNNRVVVLQDMPQFPILPLSASDISKIDCWIKQGALNN